jgi:hypothetical protein
LIYDETQLFSRENKEEILKSSPPLSLAAAIEQKNENFFSAPPPPPIYPFYKCLTPSYYLFIYLLF